jgi:hypothetical protein
MDWSVSHLFSNMEVWHTGRGGRGYLEGKQSPLPSEVSRSLAHYQRRFACRKGSGSRLSRGWSARRIGSGEMGENW